MSERLNTISTVRERATVADGTAHRKLERRLELGEVRAMSSLVRLQIGSM